MTIFFMLQGVVALVVLNVMVSRYAGRRYRGQREQLIGDEMAVRQMDYKILEEQKRENVEIQKIESLNDAVADAEKQLAAAEKELEAARKAPQDLYYVFDRLEPKPGIIWEVIVGRNPEVPMSTRMSAVWRKPRRYLVTAKTPKEAHDRASQRFFDKTGLMVAHVAPSPLFVSKQRGDVESAGGGGGGGGIGGGDGDGPRLRPVERMRVS